MEKNAMMEMISVQRTHFHHRLDPSRRVRHATALQRRFR
jgi:hypothetical protein